MISIGFHLEGTMELWDILDDSGRPTGRTVARGDRLKPGEYYLAVHIWFMNGKGEYLIQKRDKDKPLWPGMWAATGGAAIAGETSREAALREVEEELGIRPDPEQMVLLARIKRENFFTDIWSLRQEIDLCDIVMQQGEVCAVRWASRDEIEQLLLVGEFVNYRYLKSFLLGLPINNS
jgi:isopentenyldiphosphate isomerase